MTARAAQGTRREAWQEHQLVFPGRGGRPMNPTSLRHQLKRITDALKLPPVTTHMIRHTAGGLYAELDTPEEVISSIFGHGGGITRHYAPRPPETLRPYVEAVYAQLAGAVVEARRESA